VLSLIVLYTVISTERRNLKIPHFVRNGSLGYNIKSTMRNLSKLFKKFAKEAPEQTSLIDALRDKYIVFQSLLSENNHVLTIMADMEEKLSGEYLFDRHYINTNTGLISEKVLKVIEYINLLSNNKYTQLYKAYENINKEVEGVLTSKPKIKASGLTIHLEDLTKEMTDIAGGKIAHLGEMKNRLNITVPEGFSISAYAFKRFMEHNALTEKITAQLSAMGVDDLNELGSRSKYIQNIVSGAEIPEDLQDAINKSVEGLKVQRFKCSKVEEIKPLNPSTVKPVMFSVRSSAIYEDGEFTFAGQYATFLNVSEGSILKKYKEVVASLFSTRAIFYYKTKGFSEEDMVMAVGVLKMIDAKAGGVMYTTDPNKPDEDTIIINAVRGLGKAVVDGTTEPFSYVLSRKNGTILNRKTPDQQTMFVCSPEGDIKEIAVPDEIKSAPCLSDEQIKTLYSHALVLESHYGKPQDIEWAVDHNDRIYILQSRPLRTFTVHSSQLTVPRRIEEYNIILDSGVIACKGIGYGKAFILKDEGDLENFPEGAVLVARHTSTKFVTVMNKASAIITDVGSAIGHMASLSREYGIPTILDAGRATGLIADGQEITVDAFNCNIYEGKVEELLEYASKKREPFKDTHLFMTLKKVLKWIVPLNLIDPDKEYFKPEYCRTFHDITRFIHEMAMAEIFKTGKGEAIDSFEDLMSAVTFAEEGEAKRLGEQTSVLRAGIPVDARLLDIDGGIKKGLLKKATPEDILSVPFSAFLKGMTRMRWPGPRPADVKGFLGMIARTASVPEEELHKMGGKSYAIISLNYMNFSIRLGYHFSMVEAYAGENMNDNYIKFFFKGGGAATDRRLRRVRLIEEILKKLDFKVNVIEDVINAMLTKYKQSAIEEKLEIMGKLTAYTKQLDMVMYNDAVTDMFIEEFVKDHMRLVGS